MSDTAPAPQEGVVPTVDEDAPIDPLAGDGLYMDSVEIMEGIQ
jgi:hypothetical protein